MISGQNRWWPCDPCEPALSSCCSFCWSFDPWLGKRFFKLKLLKPSNRPPESAAAPPIKPLRPSAAIAAIPALAHFFPAREDPKRTQALSFIAFFLREPASAALEHALAPRNKLLSCIRRRLLLDIMRKFQSTRFRAKPPDPRRARRGSSFAHSPGNGENSSPQRLEACQKPLIESLGAIGIDAVFGVRVQVSAAPKTVFRIDGALERLTKIINGVSEA